MFKITQGEADLHNHFLRKEIDRIHDAIVSKLNIVSISKLSYLYSLRDDFSNPITVALLGRQICIHPGKKRALILFLTGVRYVPSIFVVASGNEMLKQIPFIEDSKPVESPALTNIFGSNIWMINVQGQKDYSGQHNEDEYNKDAQGYFLKNIIQKHGNLYITSACGFEWHSEFNTGKKHININVKHKKHILPALFNLIDKQ